MNLQADTNAKFTPLLKLTLSANTPNLNQDLVGSWINVVLGTYEQHYL